MSEHDRRGDDGRQETAPRFRPPPAVRARLALARAALLWERLWPALWPAVAVAGGFLVVALLDLLPILGPWAHAGVLAGFAALFAGALWRGLSGVRLPDSEAARRRLERDSGLAHRPLAGLDDHLATGPGDGAALWRAHRRWLLAHLGRMRLKPPRGSLAARDPFGLRAALVLLLVIAAAAAGPQGPERLLRALAPEVAAADAPPAQVDVWVDPPAYTGRPPRFLAPQDAAGGAIELPEGSRVLAQVQGGRGRPVLAVGGEEVAFEPVSGEAFKASAELAVGADGRLAVRQGEATLAAWRIRVLGDRAPTVEFTAPPGQGQRNALRLEYTAADDYGLQRVAVRIARSDAPEAEPLVLELPLPGLGVKTAESHSYHDLTPHPWAGLPVSMTLVAEDARGQRGESDALETVLPERTFQHPVARKLVELRKRLTLEPDNRYPVVRELGRLGERPSHFFGDVVVSLAIRSAERRLIYDQSAAAVAQVQRLLWQTALRIEEGELAVAERELRRIQRELMEALAREAPDEEIDRLMGEMQAALDRFLQALAEQLAEQMARGEGTQAEPPDPSQMLRGQDLREMLEMARRMAESGARDEARDMLARLQEILENLRMSRMARGMSERAQQALDMMRGLESLTERQQELLDRSFRRSQRLQRGQGGNRSMPGRQGEGSLGPPRLDAERQEAVRRSLGRLLRELGNALGSIPRPLGRAEQEMRGAVEALRRGEPGQAVGPQGRALDELRQGMQAMSQAFMQQMGQPGEGQEGQGDLGWRPGLQRDPLGRRTGRGPGAAGVEDVDIPDEMQLQRAHEILRELRRRSGERSRPELELDYIERLLQRF